MLVDGARCDQSNESTVSNTGRDVDGAKSAGSAGVNTAVKNDKSHKGLQDKKGLPKRAQVAPEAAPRQAEARSQRPSKRARSGRSPDHRTLPRAGGTHAVSGEPRTDGAQRDTRRRGAREGISPLTTHPTHQLQSASFVAHSNPSKIKRGAKCSQSQRQMWQKRRVAMPGTCLTSAFALVRGGAASGNRTPDLLITRRPYHAYCGVYLRQQLQFSHLWVHQRHR